MYDKFQKLLDEKGIKAGAVAKATGIDRGTFTHWRKGDYTPKPEKMQKIADYFGVPISYFYEEASDDFMGGISRDYFIQAETQEIAEEIYADPNMNLLFKCARDISPEDMDLLIDMAKRLKGDD